MSTATIDQPRPLEPVGPVDDDVVAEPAVALRRRTSDSVLIGFGIPAAGMIGVRSASTETSIRSYRGATRYDQWQFTFNIAPRPGGAMPMANSPEGGGNNPNNPNVPGGGRNPGRGNRGNPGFNPNRPTTAPPPVGTGNRGSNPAGRGRGLF